MASQYFGPKAAAKQHLLRSGGIAGEVADLRKDLDEALEAAEAGGFFRVDQWTNPPAADDDYFLQALPNTTEQQILRASAGDFLQNAIATGPRGVIITRSNHAGSFTTAVITVKGKAYGEDVTLTFTPSDGDGNDVIQSNEDLGLDTIVEVIRPAQATAAGNIDVGFNAEMVLFRGLKDLAGDSSPLREVEAGSIVTTGTFSGRKYTVPVNVPNGARDYAVAYVADPAG